MTSFEKQNISHTSVSEKDTLLNNEELEQWREPESSGQMLEAHREQVQDVLHESLVRLHKLSKEKTTLPHMQKALCEEVEKLDGIEKYIKYLYDEYKKAKEESHIDPLTRLPNRRAFEIALEAKIDRARKDSAELYVLYIDIDNFKEVNDVFGHEAGDEYLRLISNHIIDGLRPDDMIARLGGDEFAVTIFLRNPNETSDEPFDHREESDAIATRIYQGVRLAKEQLWKKISIKNEKNVSESRFLSSIASIGGVRFDGKQDADSLMKRADAMMYRIKDSGKSGIGWHSEQEANSKDTS